MSFIASSGISTITYVQQSSYDYNLMIITNSISVLIISISIFLVYRMKLEYTKLREEKQKISDELDLITNSNITTRSMASEPIYDQTPRQDNFINQLLTYFNVNLINQIYFNKQLNRIELNLV